MVIKAQTEIARSQAGGLYPQRLEDTLAHVKADECSAEHSFRGAHTPESKPAWDEFEPWPVDSSKTSLPVETKLPDQENSLSAGDLFEQASNALL